MLSFTEEQVMIRESVERFLVDEFDYRKRQEIARNDDGFLRSHWDQFAELGLLAIPVPEESGGIGGNAVDIAVVIQQMGRALMRTPYLDCIGVAVPAIRMVSGTDNASDLLSAIATGEEITGCAFSEGDDYLAQPETSLQENDGELKLNGCKRLVPWGAQAGRLLVSATQDKRTVLVSVPTELDGINRMPYRQYDGSRACDFAFNNVSIDESQVLGELTTEILERLHDIRSALICMEASAIMWSVHDQTLEYMKIREQFGQTLASMQSLQHRIVDVYVRCQLSQSMAEDAILAVEEAESDVERTRRVSAAKAYIGDYGVAVGKEGIQLHGGIGMTDDLPIGHYFKRLAAISQSNGNADWHRSRIGQLGTDGADS